jgi:DNA repair protein RadC
MGFSTCGGRPKAAHRQTRTCDWCDGCPTCGDVGRLAVVRGADGYGYRVCPACRPKAAESIRNTTAAAGLAVRQETLPGMVREGRGGAVPVFTVRTRRAEVVAEGPQLTYRGSITAPATAAAVVSDLLAGWDREAFVCLWVDTRHQPIGAEVVAVGTLDECHVHPREVFKGALVAGAAAVIVAHNHPSGCPEPSPDDLRLTARLVEAGRLLGVEVLDSLVVAEDDGGRRWVSLRERGHVKPHRTILGGEAA